VILTFVCVSSGPHLVIKTIKDRCKDSVSHVFDGEFLPQLMGVALAALHELREVKQMEIAKTANFCELFLAQES